MNYDVCRTWDLGEFRNQEEKEVTPASDKNNCFSLLPFQVPSGELEPSIPDLCDCIGKLLETLTSLWYPSLQQLKVLA